MKQTILKLLALGIIGLSATATADPIPVTYDIGEYTAPGFSGSWLHEATGCQSEGALGTLYMCGAAERIAGTITGMYYHNLGILRIIGGLLTSSDGTEYDVRRGVITDDGSIIQIGGLGVFWFEDFDMGPGLPNSFDGSEFVLWGQNTAAYCDPDRYNCRRDRWGIDLYGVARVPEPGTLALFGIGLLGLGLARRRKTARIRG